MSVDPASEEYVYHPRRPAGTAAAGSQRRSSQRRSSQRRSSQRRSSQRRSSQRRSSQRRSSQRRSSRPRRLALVALLLSGLVLAGVGSWGFATYRNVERVSVTVDAAAAGEPENWLIVGSDSRAEVDETETELGGDEGVQGRRSDSMMVARLDPETREVSVLAIPRDLLVTLPDGHDGRINGAYNEGAQAVVDTIEASLDVPVHHYAEIDFSAFEAIVDELDGIPVHFDRPVRDTHSGLDIDSAGCHVLDGRSALAFARSRKLRYLDDDGRWRTDPTGDLGRISRQQYLIGRSVAMAGQLGVTRFGSIRSIIDVVVRHVALDDSVGVADLLALARRFGSVDLADLETTAVPTVPHRTDAGAEVLLLDDEAADAVLAPFRGEVGDDTPPSSTDATTSTMSTTLPPMVPGTVELVNASGVDGAARSVADALSGSGAEIGQLATAVDVVEETIVATGSEATALAAAVSARLGDAEVEMDDNLAPSTVRVVLADDEHLTAARQSLTSGAATNDGDATAQGSEASGASGTDQGSGTGVIATADGSPPTSPTTATTTIVGWVPPDATSASVCR